MNDPATKPRRMLALLASLVAAWLLWSGIFEPLLLSLGALSCLLTFLVVWRMGYFDKDIFALRFSFRLAAYWAWLIKEIVMSSLEVARVVLSPRLPVSCRFIELKATSSNTVDQVILANSITLTPGTLTLDLHDGILKVHTLTQEGANALIAGEMDRRVAKLREA